MFFFQVDLTQHQTLALLGTIQCSIFTNVVLLASMSESVNMDSHRTMCIVWTYASYIVVLFVSSEVVIFVKMCKKS